jgi:hypothetical protein
MEGTRVLHWRTHPFFAATLLLRGGPIVRGARPSRFTHARGGDARPRNLLPVAAATATACTTTA